MYDQEQSRHVTVMLVGYKYSIEINSAQFGLITESILVLPHSCNLEN